MEPKMIALQTRTAAQVKLAGQDPLPIFMRKKKDFSNLYIKSLLGLSTSYLRGRMDFIIALAMANFCKLHRLAEYQAF